MRPIEPAKIVRPLLSELEIFPIEAVEGVKLRNYIYVGCPPPYCIMTGYTDDHFLRLLRAINEPTTLPLDALRLSRNNRDATTKQIVNAVPPKQRFRSFEELAGRMFGMLRKQPNGEAGRLNNKNRYTLFVYDEGVVCSFYNHWDKSWRGDWNFIVFLCTDSRTEQKWGYGTRIITR